MDSIRLNPDAVRRALPDRPTAALPEPDEQERLEARVREVEERLEDGPTPPSPAAGR